MQSPFSGPGVIILAVRMWRRRLERAPRLNIRRRDTVAFEACQAITLKVVLRAEFQVEP